MAYAIRKREEARRTRPDLQPRNCIKCGAMIVRPTRPDQKRCSLCQQSRGSHRADPRDCEYCGKPLTASAKRGATMHQRCAKFSNSNIAAIVMHDPEGEFAPGATFSGGEFAHTLRAGYWNSGMIFERAGKLWRVSGTELKPIQQEMTP